MWICILLFCLCVINMKHEKNANATEILCAILQLILCICNLLVSRMFIVRPLHICIPQIKSHHVNHTHTHITVGEDIRFCNSRCWHNFFRSWFFGHQSIRSPKWFMSRVTMKMRDTKWLAIISKFHSVTMKNIKFLCTPFDCGGGGVCVDVNMCAFHFTAIIGWIHQGTCLTFERLSSVARIKIISFNSMLLRRMIASLPLQICRWGIVPKKHHSLCVYIPNIAHIFFFSPLRTRCDHVSENGST